MSNCSNHKRDVAGISDMKELAAMIGDLHYEALAELLKELGEKLEGDGLNDLRGGRRGLAENLCHAAIGMRGVAIRIRWAWNISKPYMTDNTSNTKAMTHSEPTGGKREEETLGNILKKARESAGLTFKQVLDQTGVSNQYLSNLENDKIKTHSASVMWKLSELYGLSYMQLCIISGIVIPKNK